MPNGAEPVSSGPSFPCLEEAIRELGGPNKAAEVSGISKMRFYDWRSGRSSPHPNSLKKLHKAYPKYSVAEYMAEFIKDAA